jgi:acylpyruvate hydrolase
MARPLFEGHEEFPEPLGDVLHRGGDALSNAARQIERSGAAVDVASLETLVPLPQPGKLLCVGLNYLDHAKEGGMAVPDYPTLFARFSTGLVAHGQPLVVPKESDFFDYGFELVAVIGKAGRRISEADALDHVAGYTIFNDGSVRDYQLRTPQWTIGKNFNGTGALGPDFVTADELPAGVIEVMSDPMVAAPPSWTPGAPAGVYGAAA